jgi:hypothetical protein
MISKPKIERKKKGKKSDEERERQTERERGLKKGCIKIKISSHISFPS